MMKKNIIILCAIWCCFLSSGAQSITLQDAMVVANNYACGISKNNQVLKVETISLTKKAPIYLVHLKEGWILLSSERATTPILAESPTGSFPSVDEMPDGMKWIISYYESAIQYARDSLTEEYTNAEWNTWSDDSYINMRDSIRTSNSEYVIEPLEVVQWNQSHNNSPSCGKPYNYFCPTWTQPSCDHTYVGCSAVAMAQVMWYYQWPKSAIVPACMNDSNGNVCDDIRLAEYDWSLMPPKLFNSSSWDEVYEVAGFLRDCGYALHMRYNYDGSRASLTDISSAMTQKFHYKPMVFLWKDNWSSQTWMTLLKNSINQNRPIIYSGYSDNTLEAKGHAFVIFGYQNDKFRINWGWRGIGIYDLYTLSPLMADSAHNYSYKQCALIGIEPNYPSCSPSEIQWGDVHGNPFEVYGGTNLQTSNMTILSGERIVIYAGNEIKIQPPFTILSGANVHLAIRDMHCDLTDLDNSSGLLISDSDSIDADTPEPQYLPARTTEETITSPALVQPNPAKDWITIQTEQAIKSISIFDYSGRCVLQTESADISIGHLPPGMYIVRVYTVDGQTLQSKFVHK